MTTINNIADLLRILEEQPEWAEALRNALLTRELLELPAKFAEFVQETRENNRLMRERMDRMDARQDRMETQFAEFIQETRENNRQMRERLNSLEGRFTNFEGSEYERKVRYKVLYRAMSNLVLDSPYLAMTQHDPPNPEFNRVVARALRSGTISREENEDLHESDIIISDRNNRHVVVEVSLTADRDDVKWARRRSDILSVVTGGSVVPAVVTAHMNEALRGHAATEKAETFFIPYP